MKLVDLPKFDIARNFSLEKFFGTFVTLNYSIPGIVVHCRLLFTTGIYAISLTFPLLTHYVVALLSKMLSYRPIYKLSKKVLNKCAWH